MAAYEEGIRRRDEAAARAGLDSLGVRFLFADWTGPIGHIALLDVHAKLTALGLLSPEDRVLVAKAVANPAYLQLWRKHYPRLVSDASGRSALSTLLPYLRDYASVIRFVDGRYLPLHAAATMVERRWAEEKRSPLLLLPDEEREHGRARLAELGLPPDAWFVGLHVRQDPGSPRDIHNAEIATYELAIEAIVHRGGWVVRMGDPGMPPLRARERVLDYAHSPLRSDRLDVFVCAECRFFVGTASGPIGIPPTFGRPCVETNWAPLAFRHWVPGNVFVPKLYRSTATGELLQLEQILASDVGYTPLVARLQSLGVELVENSAEELRDVVVEMMDRLDGKAEYSPEDEVLQQRLDALSLRSGERLFGCSRGGRDWLRSRADLFAE
ncbi:MAG: TIGR04372 family glycosyltransferase [Actinobacteria bacterium]|nr:TIGR04372 family glycosyltransferase [Actinomycetota bacterium]